MSKKLYTRGMILLLATLFFAFSFQVFSAADDDINKLYPVYPEYATDRIDPSVLQEHLINYYEAIEQDNDDFVRFTPGDLNSDGKINSADAKIALRYSARLDTQSTSVKLAGDTNEDGRVTSADARKLLRVAAKLDSIVIEREANVGEKFCIDTLGNYTSASWRIVEMPENLQVKEIPVKESLFDKESTKSDRQVFEFLTSTKGSYKIVVELSGMNHSARPIQITYLYTVK